VLPRDVELRLGQELLELRVLVLELAQPAHVAGLHTSELGLPLVKRVLADAVASTDLFGSRAAVMLGNDRHDLLVGKPGLAHRSSPFD